MIDYLLLPVLDGSCVCTCKAVNYLIPDSDNLCPSPFVQAIVDRHGQLVPPSAEMVSQYMPTTCAFSLSRTSSYKSVKLSVTQVIATFGQAINWRTSLFSELNNLL